MLQRLRICELAIDSRPQRNIKSTREGIRASFRSTQSAILRVVESFFGSAGNLPPRDLASALHPGGALEYQMSNAAGSPSNKNQIPFSYRSNLKSLLAFSVVAVATTSSSTPEISATFRPTRATFAGSFRFPRKGTGVR
jgi:hypothetical protein